MALLIDLDHATREALLDGMSLSARFFWGADPELCAELAAAPVAELQSLGSPGGAEGQRAAGELADWVAGRRGEELCAELDPIYVRLFVASPGGVPAPLYHSCYQGEGLLMGPPAAEMARRLGEAGLSLEGVSQEPPDHLAVELEYLLLLLEQGWQVASGKEPGDAAGLLAAAAAFAGEFLAPWLERFIARLEADLPDGGSAGPYPAAARLALALAQRVAQG